MNRVHLIGLSNSVRESGGGSHNAEHPTQNLRHPPSSLRLTFVLRLTPHLLRHPILVHLDLHHNYLCIPAWVQVLWVAAKLAGAPPLTPPDQISDLCLWSTRDIVDRVLRNVRDVYKPNTTITDPTHDVSGTPEP